jgi:BirA family biotin operon repressor/biotin-[acetyl-CoA-carboxylase] ligase
VAPLAVALAVEEIAAAKGGSLHCDLKWPNDVLLNDLKLAGVLIETTTNPEGATVALVGVGVNVNVEVAKYPEIAGIAISARDVLGFELPREEVLAAFCNHFEALYEDAVAGSDAPFHAWRERLVTLGREVTATGAGEAISGRAVDVDQDGALIIEQAGGARRRVDAGDVTLSGS